ncbi:50S ribosomal protein L30 [Candidatus Woesearchaeota archaeon]|nr:MAG: 50S ribosomal protein L30 [Candidatus Woesearchaeota archaeon ex4484_78]RLE47017.1 MAG: 50S ribosomal protein L30 [Candidatus Woesearchaeota archaeon]
MAKKKTENNITEIRKLLEEKRLVIGTEETLKQLHRENIKKIFLASNCKKEAKEDLTHYCKIYKIECKELTQTNEELGTICKKPFAISVIGVLSK